MGQISMNDYKTYIDLINKHLKNSIGRYNSRKLCKKWFENNDLIDLYNEINDKTSSIQNRTFGERLWAYENLPIPKCIICNSPAKRYDHGNHWSDYCSHRCAIKSEKRHEKISKSKQERDHTESNIKRANTNIEKYGKAYHSQRQEVKDLISLKTKQRMLSEDAFKCLHDEEWLKNEYITKERTSVEIGKELGVDSSTVIDYCRKYDFTIRHKVSRSSNEREICDFLDSLNIEYSTNDMSCISPYEIDIYIPSVKVAIEINGLYWHSLVAGDKKRGYHKVKYDLCREKGIILLQFWEDDINEKLDIIQSMIKYRLRLLERRYFARNLSILEIEYKEYSTFFNENHIQGAPSFGNKGIGLFDDENNLISSMTYFESKNICTLTRFASLKNTSVVGGFSKLLKYVEKNLKSNTIRTFSHNDLSDGDVYRKHNFKCVADTIDLHYTDYKVLYNRQKFMKHKIKDMFKNYDENLTEIENMINNRYDIIYKSGVKTWIKFL